MVFRSLTWWVGIGVMGLALIAMIVSAPWSLGGKLFPWIVGSGMMITAGIHSVIGLKRGLKTNIEDTSPEESLTSTRSLGILAWIIGFLALIPLIGHQAAVPLFIIVFMVANGEKLWLSVVIGFFIWAFIFFILIGLVHITFAPSVLSRLLGL